MIPKSNDKLLRFTKSDLEGAVRRASVLSSEKARPVKFHFGSGTLTVTASNPEMGEAREEIASEYQGEEFEIAFNAQYMSDFLAVCETERVRLELKDGATQVLLRPDVEEDAVPSQDESEAETDPGKDVRHFYVLMPMRL